MTRYIIILIFSLISICSTAQKNSIIKGSVLDSSTQNTVPGASIIITNTKDSLNQRGTITNNKGDFLMNAKPGDYQLSISFIGYKTIKKTIHLDKTTLHIGQLKLVENKKMLSEINIIETLPPTKQKGDTTIFNPDAYKVNSDANAEELVAKMPGFYSVNGKLSAQGQVVKEVLVDGKKFFGKDVNKALETLPSDIIKNIEVYEYKSDKSKFSGFKDKKKSKTINIITKNKSNNMRFGRIAGGIGKNEKHAIKANINQFSEKTRYTLTGDSRNVNAPLHLSRRRAYRRSISGNDIKENNLGFNFNTKGKKENELSANYRYSDNDTKSENRSFKTYTSLPLENQTQSRKSVSENNQASHDFDLDWDIVSDSKNHIGLRSSLSTSDSKSKSTSFSETKLQDQFINSNKNLSSTNNRSTDFSQDFFLTRKFNKKERTLSVHASYRRSDGKNNNNQKSEVKGESEQGNQSIDQISNQKTNSNFLNTNLSFSEKIGKYTRLTLGYNYSINSDKTEKESYNYDPESKDYSKLDILTSNKFKNSTINNTSRISYSYQSKIIGITLGGEFKFTELKNDESFPNKKGLKKDYFSILPSANFSYTINESSLFNIYYRMGISNPSANQLQEIVNISNPLYISMGNSNLKQTQNHNLMLFYTSSNMERGSFTSINVGVNKARNTIGKRTVVAQKDTLINEKYKLPKGGQFSQSINLNGQYNISGRITYSIPVKKLHSKLNINTSAIYSHNPTLVNNRKSFSNSLNLNQSFKLSSNISEKLDFTISSRTRYSVSSNTNLKSKSSKYFSQTNSLNLYWNFFKSFILKSNTNFVHKNNINTRDVENNWLIDIGISSKIFKNKRGEISLVAYDILNQTSERSHYVNDLYTSDNYSKKLNKFYMLSFTYKIRKGNKKSRNKSMSASTSNSYRMMN